MSATEVVHCMLTALFAAAAIRALRHGVLTGSTGWRSRVDHFLHTAMALTMAVMPWNWGRVLPEAPLTAFFAAAALWFLLNAASHCEKSVLTATAPRLPYAAGMAAMAWMTHSIACPSHETLTEGLPAAPQVTHLGPSAGESTAANAVTGVLALYLTVCALRSLTRGMPALRRASDPVPTRIAELFSHFWAGSMTLGTVIMLLMHH
jgi:hypothetical protein